MSRISLLWAAPRCALPFVTCSGLLLRAVPFFPGRVVRLPCSRCGLLSGFVVRCLVLWSAVSLGAVLHHVAPPCVVLVCAVLLCFARLVPLLAVSRPRVLSVALGSCAFRRSVLWCFPALCALCCASFVVVWFCVLLFAAVLCVVAVLVCPAVRSLSSPLCAVPCCAVLVRLRCVVRAVCAFLGARCRGALLSVVLLLVMCCGAVLGLAVRVGLLVACFGVGVPVWLRGLLPGGRCGLLRCLAPLCCVLWCCAGVWCCAVVLCCVFAVLFVLAVSFLFENRCKTR